MISSPFKHINCDAFVNQIAIDFCEAFISGTGPRFVLGRNAYAESIARTLNIEGFVDDFTTDAAWLGLPVLRCCELPKDALVVSVVLGRPLTAGRRLDTHNIRHLDYFAFYKYSGLSIAPIPWWHGFNQHFNEFQDQYDDLWRSLADGESKQTLERIIRFRLSADLGCMSGFVDAQEFQYFEDFLALGSRDETFVDVGGYDGFTSAEFIRHCPDYRGLHIFEPDPSNMALIRARLADFDRICYHPIGLGNTRAITRFHSSLSTSRISDDGELVVDVDRLDNVIKDPYSFLKLDIEGGEVSALMGAEQSIREYFPRIAVSVYHRPNDMVVIPKLIMGFRDDYEIFLRHYTEGVVETVMFFIPRLPTRGQPYSNNRIVF